MTARSDELPPKVEEASASTAERTRTGALLISVAVVDTVLEGRLWIREGVVMLIVLVLIRLGLLVYGVTLLRHERNG